MLQLGMVKMTLLTGAVLAAAMGAAQAQDADDRGSWRSQRFIERLDTDNDGLATGAEITGERNRMFRYLDADADGMLSVDEFRRGSSMSNWFRTTTLFDLLDTNGDQTVTLDELEGPSARWFTRYDTDANGVLDSDELPGRAGSERMQRFISRLDSSGDGAIDRVEVSDERTRMFDEMDADSNGVLSVDEFRRSKSMSQWFRTTTMFDLLDVNADQAISPTEVQGATARWLTRYDANGDGQLEAGELPKRHGHR